MRRNFKNIRHKSRRTPGLQIYEIPMNSAYSLRIMAGSQKEAEKIANQLAANCADRIIRDIGGLVFH